jgi:GMP synthase (glutamine-hydrolysing)
MSERTGARVRKAVALRHLAFEDLGLIGPWLETGGWQLQYHDVGVHPLSTLRLDEIDLLVVLGAPIGVEDDALYPFLGDEVRLVRERIDSGLPILGICLGAQLMARALGARVRPMGAGVKEIGYAPLTLAADAVGTPIARIGTQPVLHWHGDQFALPEGVASLATTPVCPHQAFMVGTHAMAWQFHLEVDATRIEQWLIGHTMELSHAGVSLAMLRELAALHHQGLAQTLDSVMSDWFARLGWS